LPSNIVESSGAIIFNNRLITHNDSGGENKLFEVDLTTQQVARTVTISNATNIDWEDITQDDTFIYIGDFGNNNGFTKNWVDGNTKAYAIPKMGYTSVLQPFVWVSYGFNINDIFSGSNTQTVLSGLGQEQVEGITFIDDNSYYMTSESFSISVGSFTFMDNAKLMSFSTNDDSLSKTAIELENNVTLYPNPVSRVLRIKSNGVTSFKKSLPFVVLLLVLSSCWKDKSPEDLIRLKDKFKSQVSTFENKKESANKFVSKGLSSLGDLKAALEDAKNEDKEFAKVYGDWEKVNKRVNNLNKEYEDLKTKASNLFTAMETQTNSLSDEKSKSTCC